MFVCTRGIQSVQKSFITTPEGKNHLGDMGIDGRIIFKYIFEKQSMQLWIVFIWLRIWLNSKLLCTR